MGSSSPKARRCWIVLGVIVPTMVVLLLVSGVFQWSALNCWHDDVDINTGRLRHTRFLLYCQVGERTEETWVSRAIDTPSRSPNWQRVNTFSPFVQHSPHYQYHGAIHQIEMLALAERMLPFESEARCTVARTLLALWQSTGTYSGADRYVQDVTDVARGLSQRRASTVRASDLPADGDARTGEDAGL